MLETDSEQSAETGDLGNESDFGKELEKAIQNEGDFGKELGEAASHYPGSDFDKELAKELRKAAKEAEKDDVVLIDGEPAIKLEEDTNDSEKPEKKGGKAGDIDYRENDVVHPMINIPELDDDDLPAIKMDLEDYKKLSSYNSQEFIDKKSELEEQGKYREALQMEIDDIREKCGDKYNDAIAEMMESQEGDTGDDKPYSDARLPQTGGEWEGEEGNSKWVPDREKKPESTLTNPEEKTWGEILDENEIDGVSFNEGEPDFSEVSKGTVEIGDFSEDRDDNFDAADERLAEEKGCTKDDVRNWRKEHQYTWHERSDMKTMDKVPRTVHGNIPHEGGIAAKKKENANA